MKINAAKIKLTMAREGLTQVVLAERAGIGRATLINALLYETCTAKTLLKIADALELEPETLIKES